MALRDAPHPARHHPRVTAGIARGSRTSPSSETIRQELRGVERVVIVTDHRREGSMIAHEVLEHLGWCCRVDRLKLRALDDNSIQRAPSTSDFPSE